jgi:AAA15 family ATPase/GTPase
MLVQFKLRNYKTFRDEAKLSLVPSKYYKERLEENLFEVPKFGMQLLKSAVIYGANASGKSKLVEGLGFMKQFIMMSSKDMQKGDPIDIQPFRLSTETENEPSEFEIIFIHDGEMFRYGFEVTREKVVSEWLWHREKTKEVELFYRDGQEFEIHRHFKVGEMLTREKLVRSNALMLSVAAQFNDSKSGKVLDWLDKFNIISGLHEENYKGYTISRMHDQDIKKEIIRMIRVADLGIEDLEADTLDIDKIPKDMPEELKSLLKKAITEEGRTVFHDVIAAHRKYDEHYNFVGLESFSMRKEESSGTRKYYALSGPVLETLAKGDTLIVDELDSKLHPNLVCKLVEIFNSREHNPHNAQLIFNTHDTNLLSFGAFRRDQIWFTEKDRYGAATLYSLSDVKNVREKEDLEENYIRGKYGAIPYLGDFSKLFADQMEPAYENEK